MQNMNISLPEPLKEFVDKQVASGRYGSASEYMSELIRADERRKAEETLEGLLLEGLDGQETELTREEWDSMHRQAVLRAEAGKNPK